MLATDVRLRFIGGRLDESYKTRSIFHVHVSYNILNATYVLTHSAKK
jgi:hypothetical protein